MNNFVYGSYKPTSGAKMSSIRCGTKIQAYCDIARTCEYLFPSIT